MNTENQQPPPTSKDEIGETRALDRLIFFSDAIFAIAITLLVLDIRVPEIPPDLAAQQLPAAVAALWPKFFSFFISFAIIGLYYWQMHYHIFHYIIKYDDRLLFINLLLLMAIAFLPFSVSLLSEYGGQKIALAIYLGNLAVAGLLLTGLLGCAVRRKLTSPAFDNRMATSLLTKTLSLPIFCVVAFVFSFWTPYGWVFALLLMVPLRVALLRLAAQPHSHLYPQVPTG